HAFDLETMGIAVDNGFFASPRLPDAHRPIPSHGSQASIRAERDGFHHARMFTKSQELLPGGHIPDPDRLIFARGGEKLAVRAERDAHNHSLGAGKDVEFRPGLGVPDAPRAIRAGRGDPAAIWTEDHAVDAAGVALQSSASCALSYFFQRRGVPNSHRLVRTARYQPVTIAAKTQTPHGITVAMKRKGFQTGGHVPDFDLLITARRSQPAAVGAKGNADESARVAAQRANELAAARVPDLDIALVPAIRAVA